MTGQWSPHTALDPFDRPTRLQLGEFLKSEKIADDEQLKAWADEAKAEVKEAEKFADEANEPEIHLAFDHNYAE